MDAKHQFKYTYSDTNLEEFSPVEVTFDMPGDVTINQMLYNFESYLKACGFYFDGHLEIVDDTLKDLDLIDELDGTLYEFDEEPQGGCMADFDKECGCEDTSSSLETKREKFLKEWNEGLAKLDNEQKQKCREEALKMSDLHYEATKEVKKNNWVHGMCNPPADDAKEYVKDCKSTGKKYNSVDAMLKSLMKKRSKDSQLY